MRITYEVIKPSEFSKRRSAYLTLAVLELPDGTRAVANLLSDKPLPNRGAGEIDIVSALRIVPYVKVKLDEQPLAPGGVGSSQVGLGTEELTF